MLRRIAARCIQWEWVVLCFVALLLFFPSPGRSVVMLVIPALWSCRKLARGRFIDRTPLDWPLLLMAIMLVVSVYATFDITHSYPSVAGVVLGIGVFYAVVHYGRTRRGWSLGLALYLLGGVALAGLALFGTAWIRYKFPILNPITERLPVQLEALIGREGRFHPNIVAGALLWLLPLLVVLSAMGIVAFAELMASSRRRWSRVLVVALWAATALVGGVFILTQSREAYLGLGLALVVMTGISLRMLFRLRSASRRRLLIGSATLLGLAAFVVARVSPERLADAVFGASQLGEGALSVQSLSSRFELWSRALYAIQDFPFTGMGMGTFQPVVTVLYPLFSIAPDTDFVHPHNHLLSAAVDLGIPGLIAYLSIWLGAAWMLWRTWRLTEANVVRTLVLGMAGCLLAYFTYGITDAIALGTKPGILWWYLLGLITALYLQVEEAHRNGVRFSLEGVFVLGDKRQGSGAQGSMRANRG